MDKKSPAQLVGTVGQVKRMPLHNCKASKE